MGHHDFVLGLKTLQHIVLVPSPPFRDGKDGKSGSLDDCCWLVFFLDFSLGGGLRVSPLVLAGVNIMGLGRSLGLMPAGETYMLAWLRRWDILAKASANFTSSLSFSLFHGDNFFRWQPHLFIAPEDTCPIFSSSFEPFVALF